jgi:anti-sigma factor RsiW
MTHLTNEQLIDYMHGGLTPQQDAAVYEHMESCNQCRAEYDAELALSDLLRAQAVREELELPATLKAEIWSRIRAAQPSPWNRFVASFRPAVAVPLAAAIALAAYFGTSYLGPRGAPSIEAAYYLQDHAALNSTVPFSDHAVNPVDLEDAAAVDNQQSSVPVQPAVYTADASQ